MAYMYFSIYCFQNLSYLWDFDFDKGQFWFYWYDFCLESEFELFYDDLDRLILHPKEQFLVCISWRLWIFLVFNREILWYELVFLRSICLYSTKTGSCTEKFNFFVNFYLRMRSDKDFLSAKKKYFLFYLGFYCYGVTIEHLKRWDSRFFILNSLIAWWVSLQNQL